MKKFIFSQKSGEEKQVFNRISSKGGSYSLAMTAVVLAIILLINILVSALPSSLTRYDISSTKLYSITSNTKVVVNALEKDVTIYWIVQSGEEDDVIEHLLSKYESLSGHIEVVKKNPDIYPTFAQQYTSETVENNSLVVECGEKSRYIGYSDIYLSELNYYTYAYDTSFDGEGAITSAIDYVISEELPKLYVLEGHGELDLSDSLTNQIAKENVEINTFSLLTEKSVPEDADCVLIHGPNSDISEEEKKLLSEYIKNGGKLMVLAGLTENGGLSNLYSIIEEYGVQAEEGVVVEGESYYYAFGTPHILLPNITEDEITNSLISESYYAIMPIAQGMTVKEEALDSVTELLTTSDSAFSKSAGYELTTYEKEEGDTDGPFALAVDIECENKGRIIWFSSSYLFDDNYNSYSSGANMELGMNALAALVGEREAIAIDTKSLNYDYLTISDSTASFLQVTMIGICPMVFLGIGVVVTIRRRKMNETV